MGHSLSARTQWKLSLQGSGSQHHQAVHNLSRPIQAMPFDYIVVALLTQLNYMSVSAEALSEHIHPRCQTDSKLQVNWSKTSQPIQVRW